MSYGPAADSDWDVADGPLKRDRYGYSAAVTSAAGTLLPLP